MCNSLFENSFYIVLAKLVEKIKETYVLPLLNDYCCATASFDLWMSEGCTWCVYLGHSFFGIWLETKTSYSWFVWNYWNYMTSIGFKSYWFFGHAYGLRNKIIAYVKDESSNLNTLTSALKSIIKCETLGLEESF